MSSTSLRLRPSPIVHVILYIHDVITERRELLSAASYSRTHFARFAAQCEICLTCRKISRDSPAVIITRVCLRVTMPCVGIITVRESSGWSCSPTSTHVLAHTRNTVNGRKSQTLVVGIDLIVSRITRRWPSKSSEL